VGGIIYFNGCCIEYLYLQFTCLLVFEYQKMTVGNRVIIDKFLPTLSQPNLTSRFDPTNFPFNAIRHLEKHWVGQISTIFPGELLWNHLQNFLLANMKKFAGDLNLLVPCIQLKLFNKYVNVSFYKLIQLKPDFNLWTMKMDICCWKLRNMNYINLTQVSSYICLPLEKFNGNEQRERGGQEMRAHKLSYLKSRIQNNLEEALLRGKTMNSLVIGSHG